MLSHTMLWEVGSTSCVGCAGGFSCVWLPADTRGVQVQGVQTPLRATTSPLFIKLQNEAARGSLAKCEAGGVGGRKAASGQGRRLMKQTWD